MLTLTPCLALHNVSDTFEGLRRRSIPSVPSKIYETTRNDSFKREKSNHAHHQVVMYEFASDFEDLKDVFLRLSKTPTNRKIQRDLRYTTSYTFGRCSVVNIY